MHAMRTTSREFFIHTVLDSLSASGLDVPDDSRSHVEAGIRHATLFLREAVLFQNSSILLDNVTWFRRHMKSSSVSVDVGDEMLRQSLHAMKTQISLLLDVPSIALAQEYLDQAIATLSAAPASTPSHLDDHEFYELQQRCLRNLIDMNPAEAEQVIRGARDSGITINDIYKRIIAPIQHEVGRLWEIGQLRVDQEHYCTETIRGIIERLLPRRSWFRSGKGAFVVCALGDEVHSMGARMVGDLFSLDGWHTIYLGGAVPVQSLTDLAGTQRNLVIGVSVTMPYHLSEARSMIEAIRASGLDAPIILGGRAIMEYPSAAASMGADLVASDAEEALEWANANVRNDPAG